MGKKIEDFTDSTFSGDNEKKFMVMRVQFYDENDNEYINSKASLYMLIDSNSEGINFLKDCDYHYKLSAMEVDKNSTEYKLALKNSKQ